jgi:drug/metabolite transporter (DMT)-like permease
VPEHRPIDFTGAALALLLSALWGANPVAIKLGLADAPPLRLALMRFVLSTIVILAYAMLTRRYDVLVIRAGEAKPIWSLGLLFVIQIALMNYGLERTTAAHGVIVLNSYAVHTVVFAHFMIPGDRLTPAKLAGVLIAYGGVIILFARSFSVSSSTLVGDLIVALSALLLGERIVYIAKAVQRLDPVRLMLYQSIIGSVGFFLIGFATEADRPTRWTSGLILSIVFQGAIIGGFNFLLNAKLLQIYRPSALATVALTTPIWGVLVAAAIGREGLTPDLLLSALLVVAGIALTARRWPTSRARGMTAG